MTRRLLPALALLLAACQAPPLPVSADAPAVPPAPAPTPLAVTSAASVEIDVSRSPLAVLAGLPVKLDAPNAGPGAVGWRLVEGDAVLTPEGLLTGRAPGWVVAAAERGGRSATLRVAVAGPEGPAFPVAPIAPLPAADPGFQAIADAATWARYAAASQAPLDAPDFASQAVLLYTADAVLEGNARLAQPEPLLVDASARLAVVFPERHSVFDAPPTSAAVLARRTWAWLVPKAAIARPAAVAKDGTATPAVVPTPWRPAADWPAAAPAAAPTAAPTPGAIAPDPGAPAASAAPLAFSLPLGACGDRPLVVAGGPLRAGAVALTLRAYAPYRLDAGVPAPPTGERTLAVLPVDAAGGLRLQAVLPGAQAPNAPFRVAKGGRYDLWWSTGREAGLATTLEICP